MARDRERERRGYAGDYDRAYRARREAWPRYDRDFGPPPRPDPQLGLHDFSERYGRYSGGPPDAYEYSERTIEHRHGRGREPVGFTRPLGPIRSRRMREESPPTRARSRRGSFPHWTAERRTEERRGEERRSGFERRRDRRTRRRSPLPPGFRYW